MNITTADQFRAFTAEHLVDRSWADRKDLSIEFIDPDGEHVWGFNDRPDDITVKIGRVRSDGSHSFIVTELATVPLALLLDAAAGRHAQQRETGTMVPTYDAQDRGYFGVTS